MRLRTKRTIVGIIIASLFAGVVYGQLYVMSLPSSANPSGASNDYGQCSWNSWGSCVEDVITGVGDWFIGLSHEDRIFIALGAAVILTIAIAGKTASLTLAFGAGGFAAGVAGYGSYGYVTGTNPTLLGALAWGSIGFGTAVIAYGGYQVEVRQRRGGTATSSAGTIRVSADSSARSC
jgi:hypothetical protein